MKTFTFISGNFADDTRGMEISIDRSQVPDGTRLGVYLDDRPVARPPGKDGAANEAAAKAAAGVGKATAAGPAAAPVGAGVGRRPPEVIGGQLLRRGGRSFIETREKTTRVMLDKLPSEVHHLTVEADRPPGAGRGEHFAVDIVQKTADGDVVGGITVIFTVD